MAHENPPMAYSILDVTEPASPELLWQLPVPHDRVRGNSLALRGDILLTAYQVAKKGDKPAGFQIYDVSNPVQPREITAQLILDETAKMFGWTVEDLCGKSRRRPLVTARQIGMYVMRELTGYSYPQIAKEFGGRDHTTVMYAVEKIKQQMNERHTTFDQVTELIARIKLGTGG